MMLHEAEFVGEGLFEPQASAQSGLHDLLAECLPALGPVVLVHRRDDAELLLRDALSLISAGSAQVIAEIGSEGPHEALRILRPGAAVLLQICLLPDSDFLAWDRLAERLPVIASAPPLCWPPWLLRLRWQARTGRFQSHGQSLRFAPLQHTSPCGERRAAEWSQRCGCGPRRR